MRYRDDPIYCTLAEAVADIARVATGGSSALALDDLVSAAADGAIEAVGSVANEIAPGKWRRKLAIGPVPAWVWRCIQRSQAGISVEKGEITIRTYDEKAEAPRRLCYYDIDLNGLILHAYGRKLKPRLSPTRQRLRSSNAPRQRVQNQLGPSGAAPTATSSGSIWLIGS